MAGRCRSCAGAIRRDLAGVDARSGASRSTPRSPTGRARGSGRRRSGGPRPSSTATRNTRSAVDPVRGRSPSSTMATAPSTMAVTPRSRPHRGPGRARSSRRARTLSASAATISSPARSCKAHAAMHGPLALVQFDAHQDTWSDDGDRLDHGTFVGRAVRAGLIDPARSIQVGIRTQAPEDCGIAIIDGYESRARRARRRSSAILARVGERRPISPSTSTASTRPSRPGTGTPVAGGLSARGARSCARSGDRLRRRRRRRGVAAPTTMPTSPRSPRRPWRCITSASWPSDDEEIEMLETLPFSQRQDQSHVREDQDRRARRVRLYRRRPRPPRRPPSRTSRSRRSPPTPMPASRWPRCFRIASCSTCRGSSPWEKVDWTTARRGLLRPAARHDAGDHRRGARRQSGDQSHRHVGRLPPARHGDLRGMVRPRAPAPELQNEAVYGLTEHYRDEDPRCAAGRLSRLLSDRRAARAAADRPAEADRRERHHHRREVGRVRRRARPEAEHALLRGGRGAVALFGRQAPPCAGDRAGDRQGGRARR